MLAVAGLGDDAVALVAVVPIGAGTGATGALDQLAEMKAGKDAVAS
jgi:hypothetical protein